MLPFIFATSALQEKDTVTIMLFHDAVHLALKGFAEKIVPVGPPQRFKEIIDDNNAKLLVCTPCAEVRNIFEKDCLDKFIFGGMNDFYESCKILDTKIICY
jgi:predicted peroxiredoxin